MTLTAIAAMLIVIFMVYLTSVKINTNVSVRDITVSGVLMYACTVSIYMLLRSFANRKGRASKAFAAVWETIEKNAVYIVENGLAGMVREYCRKWEEAEHNEARRRALADCGISLEKYLAEYAKYSRREIKKNFSDLTEYQRATILRVKKIKRLHFDESYLSVFENYGHRVAPSGGFTVRKRRKLQTIQTFFTTAISSLFSAYLALEIIADKVHLSPDFIRLIFARKDASKIVLITDSMRASGLGDGTYSLGGLDVKVSGSEARLVSNCSLAGSVLKMNLALKNICEILNADIAELAKCASLNAANSLNIPNLGEIKQGNFADFAVLDSDFKVLKTIVGGIVKYEA